MKNQLEHFLPKGQTKIKDSIFICDNPHECETCSSFLFSLNEAQINSFLEGDDFTDDYSAIRIVIPASKENTKLFTIDGIQDLIAEISQLESEEEIELINWVKTTSILITTPYFIDSGNGNVGLCLDILLKPYLDIFQVYFFEVRLEALQEKYPKTQIVFRDSVYKKVIKDEFLDKQISKYEISSFLHYVSKFLSINDLYDLTFLICWGVFDIDRKENGEWFVTMLDFNQKSKQVKNLPF